MWVSIFIWAKDALLKIIKWRYTGYILLAIAIFIGFSIINGLNTKISRMSSNQEALLDGFESPETQELNLTPSEFKDWLIAREDGYKRAMDSMNFKLNRIAEFQEFSAYTKSHGSGSVIRNTYVVNPTNIDSLWAYLKDSLLMNLTKEKLLAMDSVLVQKALFKTNGCLTGTVSWVGTTPDSVYVNATEHIDLVFIGYKKHNKGWFWRDVARFFTFRWKQIGSDKWETFMNVWNKCSGDSTNIVLNRKINISKKPK